MLRSLAAVLAAPLAIGLTVAASGRADQWVGWKRTFNASRAGLYQVVLPFHPGEWEAAPINASYAVPYSWHPDGSVRRVVYLLDTTAGAGAKKEISPATPRGDAVAILPSAPILTVNQGHEDWVFRIGATLNKWQTVNDGVVSHRLFVGRPESPEGNRCDFAVAAHLLYWRGTLMRTEIRLIGCQPDHPTERSWPLTGGVFLDGSEIMLRFRRERIGDLMCAWHRDDKLHYAVCDQWGGHGSGSHNVDYTKVRGGVLSRLAKDVEYMAQRPWWSSEWAHPIYGGTTGMHGGFGVCRPEIAAAVQSRDGRAWPMLHKLCEEWFSAPYHLVDSDGKILRQDVENPGVVGGKSWAIALGGMDYRVAYPHFGKVKGAEDPQQRGRTGEFNSHVRSNGLVGVMEFAPTPMFMDEMLHRAQNLLKIGGYEEERSIARVGNTMLEILPYVTGELRSRLIARISGRMRARLARYKAAGSRAYRSDGPEPKWIAGKKIFLPWQDQMFFGHVAACHLSGYETLQLTEDELLTATKSMRWFVDNCWQQQADGSWQSPYASASDLSVHAWSGDPGIFGQGIAGLELVKDYPKAKKILDWWQGTTDAWHPPDRWMPRRPD